jgi:hypothetical protein
MQGFIDFGYQELSEKLITFAGKAYPRFGQVVILAGGAASGKGYVYDKLIGVEGFKFDVDELKKLAAATPTIISRLKKDYNIDIKSLADNMKNPENVSKLHYVVADVLNLDNRRQQALFRSLLSANAERRPNIIFDVTLKDFYKLDKICTQVSQIGYDKKNIHIVWIVNDIEVAVRLNKKRPRTVPVEILINTHRGASNTLYDIINMGKGISKYMDGEIVFAFNKVDIPNKLFDNTWVSREKGDPRREGQASMKDANMYTGKKGEYRGGYFSLVDYVEVKKTGKPPRSVSELSDDVRRKIAKYVPDNVDWVS